MHHKSCHYGQIIVPHESFKEQIAIKEARRREDHVALKEVICLRKHNFSWAAWCYTEGLCSIPSADWHNLS